MSELLRRTLKARLRAVLTTHIATLSIAPVVELRVYPLWCTAKAANIRAISAMSVLLGIVLIRTADTSLSFTGTPVRARWFILLGFMVLSSIPLALGRSSLPGTWRNARYNFAVRVAVAWIPLLVGLIACHLFAPGDATVRAWFTLGIGVTLAGAAFFPDWGWLLAMVIGGGTIIIDQSATNLPVSQIVDAVGLWIACCWVVVASAAYVTYQANRVRWT